MKPDKPYSRTSAGTTAEAENHSASAATWQIAMMVTDASFEVARIIRRLPYIFGSVTPF